MYEVDAVFVCRVRKFAEYSYRVWQDVREKKIEGECGKE